MVVGVIVAFMSTAVLYWQFIGFSMAFGFFAGGYHAQRVTVISEFVPKKMQQNAVGVSVFFQGVGNLLISPIGGECCYVIRPDLLILSLCCFFTQAGAETTSRVTNLHSSLEEPLYSSLVSCS